MLSPFTVFETKLTSTSISCFGGNIPLAPSRSSSTVETTSLVGAKSLLATRAILCSTFGVSVVRVTISPSGLGQTISDTTTSCGDGVGGVVFVVVTVTGLGVVATMAVIPSAG